MEKQYNANHRIIKNPLFIHNIKNIMEDIKIKVKTVIIPIRDFNISALSRVKHGKNKGGLWNATDEASHI